MKHRRCKRSPAPLAEANLERLIARVEQLKNEGRILRSALEYVVEESEQPAVREVAAGALAEMEDDF